MEWERAAEAGRSRSVAKRRAARKNGKLGGRPAKRTLPECILRQPLTKEQRKKLKEAGWNQLLLEAEAKELLDYFQAGPALIGDDPMDTKLWQRKSRRMPKHILFIVRKFRLASRYILASK
jgi:hypothetical protein